MHRAVMCTQRAIGRAQVGALRALEAVLHAFAGAVGVLAFAFFGYVLMQSSARGLLAEFLETSDVLVTAVFGVCGWLFLGFVKRVNRRFDAAEQRLDAGETTLQELKSLVRQLAAKSR